MGITFLGLSVFSTSPGFSQITDHRTSTLYRPFPDNPNFQANFKPATGSGGFLASGGGGGGAAVGNGSGGVNDVDAKGALHALPVDMQPAPQGKTDGFDDTGRAIAARMAASCKDRVPGRYLTFDVGDKKRLAFGASNFNQVICVANMVSRALRENRTLVWPVWKSRPEITNHGARFLDYLRARFDMSEFFETFCVITADRMPQMTAKEKEANVQHMQPNAAYYEHDSWVAPRLPFSSGSVASASSVRVPHATPPLPLPMGCRWAAAGRRSCCDCAGFMARDHPWLASRPSTVSQASSPIRFKPSPADSALSRSVTRVCGQVL